eukprot:3483055-Pyramimonas_sp.AAC.1
MPAVLPDVLLRRPPRLLLRSVFQACADDLPMAFPERQHDVGVLGTVFSERGSMRRPEMMS